LNNEVNHVDIDDSNNVSKSNAIIELLITMCSR